jgi:hypothetical protein
VARNVGDVKDMPIFVAKILETNKLKGLEKYGWMILRCVLGKYLMRAGGTNGGLCYRAAFFTRKTYVFYYNGVT